METLQEIIFLAMCQYLRFGVIQIWPQGHVMPQPHQEEYAS